MPFRPDEDGAFLLTFPPRREAPGRDADPIFTTWWVTGPAHPVPNFVAVNSERFLKVTIPAAIRIPSIAEALTDLPPHLPTVRYRPDLRLGSGSVS
ncbi:hypothetical protein [Streptomyces hokutonensis]|uniref:hypothetical protein n=1 Tax=Streptomyces hokutonensis TaxID=1306990 RepID=UPI00382FA228